MAERASRIAPELDKWLLDGGWVVASSERAARFVATEFNRARRSDGLTVWHEPRILTWSAFVRELWDLLLPDGRMLLSAAQEVALWESILAGSESLTLTLSGPRHHLAALTEEAHALICAYAPEALDPRSRASWQNDAEKMSVWLTEFDSLCAKNALLSASRLPLELLAAIGQSAATRKQIPPLKLIGFDRFEPSQKKVLEAIGSWAPAADQSEIANVQYYHAADSSEELNACVLWCDEQLKANPHARLLVLTNDAATRRGEIERAFSRWLNTSHSPAIEFSLGVPLFSVPMVRAAMLLLRWLAAPASENELDWLFASGFSAQSKDDTASLLFVMREVRRRQLQRTEWRLKDLCTTTLNLQPQLGGWCARLSDAQALLQARAAGKSNSPQEWSLLVLEVLDALGWPGHAELSSAQFQARQRFEQIIESTAGFGFDGRSIRWSEYQNLLEQLLTESLFIAESREAPILIAGPAESAGLTADGIWMLGAEEGSWPAPGTTNPLLPLSLHRSASTPHSTAAVDWQLARHITERLRASASELRFSYASLRDGQEMKRSRLIEQLAGSPQPLPSSLIPSAPDALFTEFMDAEPRIPFRLDKVHGGANLLSDQSQCPFKSFATRRLNAQGWDEAALGFTPLEKGTLLHAIMRAIWSGDEQDGLNSLQELHDLLAKSDGRAELEAFVRRHVYGQLNQGITVAMRARILPAVVRIEEDRLTRVITEWLLYESTRQSFEVVAREQRYAVNIAGLGLDLQMDRIDKLNDGSLLVIDYKSGKASRKEWELPRPEDVQLPLYAIFGALKLEPVWRDASIDRIGGLAFAKISAAGCSFDGRLQNAKDTLISSLNGNNALVKERLTVEDLHDWKAAIEDLARDYLNGKADVDPIDPDKTCERCGLQVLCRRQEVEVLEDEAEDENGDAENGGRDDE